MPIKSSSKAGLPPGTLLHVGEEKAEKVNITLITYNKTHYEEKNVASVEECLPLKEKSAVTWINIDGLHNTKIIEELGHHFTIHPLVLEDILHTGQRPKMEDYKDYIFLILKMFSYNEKTIEIEQISLILGPNYVFSIQEREGDVFDPVRKRVRTEKSNLRKMGADYLVYSLLDAIVDSNFVILETLGEDIEDTEEEVVTDPTTETLQAIQTLKREMIGLRKSVWPLRELVSALERGESPLIRRSTLIYLRDVYDHTIQIMDTVETYRDTLSAMLDIYLSSISNRMNEIMKVLTIIATIFIPLTFLAGIYGMNFRYMPELVWKWGYPAVLLVMAGISVIMLLYFRGKKWL